MRVCNSNPHRRLDGKTTTIRPYAAWTVPGTVFWEHCDPVQRLRPKLMTVTAVLASLVPILWETGIGSDVMKPIV
jgi:hypothetical protein